LIKIVICYSRLVIKVSYENSFLGWPAFPNPCPPEDVNPVDEKILPSVAVGDTKPFSHLPDDGDNDFIPSSKINIY